MKPFVLSTDLDTLGIIGSARNLQLQASVGGSTVDYVLWDDQRKALARLVQLPQWRMLKPAIALSKRSP